MSVRTRLLSNLQKRLKDAPPPLRLTFWDGEVFDFAPVPRVTLTIRSPAVVRHLLLGRFDRLGDAYVAGDILADGDIGDILRVGIDLAERLGRSARTIAWLKPNWLAFRHSRANDAKAIAHHYDVSDDFYRLWLDRRMIYSCAYFRTGLEDIDTAQEQKLAHICRKLRLVDGERLLDIGCGGLVHYAARHYGVSALGITNSQAQARAAQARIEADGLNDRVEIRLQDYRDLDGRVVFDKIASVGMYEHVGAPNWPTYFATIERLLKPGGMLLNHGIITTDARGRPQGPPGGEFIGRYVFPGGALANLPRVLTEIARTGLEAIDAEDLRPHYARTLALWIERLEANRDAAIAAASIERYRVWRMYLAGMVHAFDRGWLSIAQVLAAKKVAGRPAPRPWTREYQYADVRDSAGRISAA